VAIFVVVVAAVVVELIYRLLGFVRAPLRLGALLLQLLELALSLAAITVALRGCERRRRVAHLAVDLSELTGCFVETLASVFVVIAVVVVGCRRRRGDRCRLGRGR